MEKIFIIQLTKLGMTPYPINAVYNTAFRNLEDAQKLIENRPDNPEKIEDMKWKSEEYRYTILMIDLK